MPTVVFIHGVGGMPKESHSSWDTALRANLEQASPAWAQLPMLTVSYDDLFANWAVIRGVPADHLHEPVVNEAGRKAARADYYRRERLLRIAVAADPRRADPPDRLVPPLLNSELTVRLPVLNMRQAGHYRHDDNLRAAVLDRVSDAIKALDDEVILIAHSLGSIVALDMLHVRDVRVRFLITIGSPLGIDPVWGTRWLDHSAFPYDRLGGWLNVVNLRDPITWQRGAARKFPQAVDAFVRMGSKIAGPGNYHDPATYLKSSAVLIGFEQVLAP